MKRKEKKNKERKKQNIILPFKYNILPRVIYSCFVCILPFLLDESSSDIWSIHEFIMHILVTGVHTETWFTTGQCFLNHFTFNRNGVIGSYLICEILMSQISKRCKRLYYRFLFFTETVTLRPLSCEKRW